MRTLFTSARSRGLLVMGAKLLLAMLLLWWLARSGAIRPGAILHQGASVASLSVAALCVLVALALGVYRWSLVMGALGVPMGYLRALQVYWITAFVGTFLPGAVAGDVLRACYVARETPQARARAAASVVVDRILGLLGFLLSGLALILTRFDVLQHSVELRGIATRFGLILLISLASLFVAAWLGPRAFAADFFRRLRARLRGAGGAAIRHVATLGYRDVPVLLVVLGVSLLIPSLLACALLPFLSALAPDYTNLIDIGIASNAAQVANTIPLTPNGIGIGEGAFEYVLALLGQPSAGGGHATAFLLLRLVTVAVNAIGGILFFVPGKAPNASGLGASSLGSEQ